MSTFPHIFSNKCSTVPKANMMIMATTAQLALKKITTTGSQHIILWVQRDHRSSLLAVHFWQAMTAEVSPTLANSCFYSIGYIITPHGLEQCCPHMSCSHRLSISRTKTAPRLDYKKENKVYNYNKIHQGTLNTSQTSLQNVFPLWWLTELPPPIQVPSLATYFYL